MRWDTCSLGCDCTAEGEKKECVLFSYLLKHKKYTKSTCNMNYV